MRVAVIHGGISTEYDVSVASGQGIVEGLTTAGHDVVPMLIDPDGEWHLPQGSGRLDAVRELLRCDVAVPALHGVQGEDGTVQGLLEMLGVPYVGSGVRASAVCLDKHLTKLVAAQAGVPVAAGLVLSREQVAQALATPRGLTDLVLDLAHAGVHFPVFVKPVHGGSSIGVSRVEHREGLALALLAAGEDSVLLECEVRGLEVDVPVLEQADGSLRCGPALLVDSDPDEPFFTAAAKYTSTQTRFTVPAPLAPSLTRELERLALTAAAALEVRGLARVDFLVTPDGPVLNEVNTFPGFTEQSQFPCMWAAAGMPYADLVDTLVTVAAATRAPRASRLVKAAHP